MGQEFVGTTTGASSICARRIAGTWGGFVALGIGELGGVASVNLLVASLASVLVIGAAMLAVDLIFQGWGLIMFGVALKARASCDGRRPATV